MNRTVIVALGAAFLLLPSVAHGQHSHTAFPAFAVLDEAGIPLGSVALAASSCDAAAADHVRRGLALMHNMTYGEASASFLQAVEEDAGCAFGYWGAAMTLVHPLWPDAPSVEAFREGRALLARARENGSPGAHEDAYLAAAEAYYHDGVRLRRRTGAPPGGAAEVGRGEPALKPSFVPGSVGQVPASRGDPHLRPGARGRQER